MKTSSHPNLKLKNDKLLTIDYDGKKGVCGWWCFAFVSFVWCGLCLMVWLLRFLVATTFNILILSHYSSLLGWVGSWCVGFGGCDLWTVAKKLYEEVLEAIDGSKIK